MKARYILPSFLLGAALAAAGTAFASTSDVTVQSSWIAAHKVIAGARSNVLSVTFANNSANTEDAILDVEISDASGKQAGQSFREIDLGGHASAIVSLDSDQDLPAGTYTLEAGVFSPHWQAARWYNSLDSFNIIVPEDGNISMTKNLVLPQTIKSGASATLSAQFSSPVTQNTVLIDLELRDANGKTVEQKYWDNLIFPAHDTNFRTIYEMITPPSLPPGTYSFSAGIFSPHWGNLIHWYDTAGTLTVQ